jgi:hypothetical protein
LIPPHFLSLIGYVLIGLLIGNWLVDVVTGQVLLR